MMGEGLPSKIPIAVVDMDNTVTSRTLIRQLDAFPKTTVKFKSLSFREARIRMERAEVFAVLTIPRGFSQKAVSGERPKLVFYTNNAFLISGSLLFQDLRTISVLASASVGLQIAEAKGYTEKQIMPVLQPISVESHPIGNPWLSYSVYLNNTILPGILNLMIMVFTISCLGAEVKSGTAQKLMNMGSGSIIKVLTGKLLPYTILFFVVALLYMSVLYYYNKFPINSGFLPMCLNYLCLIIAAQGTGLILLGVFTNYRIALSVSSLWGMITFSISGFSFPALAMDPSLLALGYLFPLRYFFLVYVDQALNGLSMGYSACYYAAMLTFMAVACLFFLRIKKYLVANVYEE
jgi:ABC-2 type transport system permease protein